jgi:hypothetical protein
MAKVPATRKGEVDPIHFQQLASLLKKEDLEPFAKRAMGDLLGRHADRHRGWKISFYCFLILTVLAALLAIGLSIVAGLKLHAVEMEVVRWTWAATFGSGGATFFSRLKQQQD